VVVVREPKEAPWARAGRTDLLKEVPDPKGDLAVAPEQKVVLLKAVVAPKVVQVVVDPKAAVVPMVANAGRPWMID
jgi:hypothetical protein